MPLPAGSEFGYDHSFHAGNAADVFKHLVLCAVIEHAVARGPVLYVDSHAGAGLHPLRPTGEWTEGLWRLWRSGVPEGPAFADWWRAVQEHNRGADRPLRCPGSPLLAARLLPAGSRLVLFETNPESCAGLGRLFGDDPRVAVHPEDGFDGVQTALSGASGTTIVLIDPSYAEKAEWTRVVDATEAAHRACPAATILVWYPVKSWTRPRTMVGALRERLAPGATLDLVTTPLEYRRNRLNGSGLFLLNFPDALLDRLCAALPEVARRCATMHGRWSLHAEGWSERTPRAAPSESRDGA